MEYPKVDGLYVADLANEPLNHFMSRVTAVLVADGSPEVALGEKLEAERVAFAALIRKQDPKMGTTLKEIDKNADRFWRGTRNQLKVSIDSPDDDERAAALEIWPVFSALPDPTNKKYETEYGALNALLPKLRSFDDETLQKAHVLVWINALSEAVDAFKAKQDSDTDAHAADLGQNKKARDQMIETYNDICARLNAIMVLCPDDAHAALIEQINRRIDDHRLSEKLSANKKKKPEDADPAAPAAPADA